MSISRLSGGKAAVLTSLNSRISETRLYCREARVCEAWKGSKGLYEGILGRV